MTVLCVYALAFLLQRNFVSFPTVGTNTGEARIVTGATQCHLVLGLEITYRFKKKNSYY